MTSIQLSVVNLVVVANCMAVASGPAGPVLAGPVFTVIFGTAHAYIINNG